MALEGVVLTMRVHVDTQPEPGRKPENIPICDKDLSSLLLCQITSLGISRRQICVHRLERETPCVSSRTSDH